MFRWRARARAVDIVPAAPFADPGELQARPLSRALPRTAAIMRRSAPTAYLEDVTPGYGPQAMLHFRPHLTLVLESAPRDVRQSRYRFLEGAL